ncbi:MAG: hypothetical protein JXR95_01675 [Deltaproteobacteria bacterium]|nr:hypothetical protein [Deltaproteobacteria bacterium]
MLYPGNPDPELEDEERYTTLGIHYIRFLIGLSVLIISAGVIFLGFYPQTIYHPQYKLPPSWTLFTSGGLVALMGFAFLKSSFGVTSCRHCGVPLKFTECYYALEAESRVISAVTNEHPYALVGVEKLGEGFSRMHIKLFYCPKCRFSGKLGASRIDTTYGEIYFQPLKEIHGDSVESFINLMDS